MGPEGIRPPSGGARERQILSLAGLHPEARQNHCNMSPILINRQLMLR
jgi:hypothetical protein